MVITVFTGEQMTASLRNSLLSMIATLCALWPAHAIITHHDDDVRTAVWVILCVLVLGGSAQLIRFLTRRPYGAHLIQCGLVFIAAIICYSLQIPSHIVIPLALAAAEIIAVDILFITGRNVIAACIVLLPPYAYTAIVHKDHDWTSIAALGIAWAILLSSRTFDHIKLWPRGLSSPHRVRGYAVVFLTIFTTAIALIVAIVSSILIGFDEPIWHKKPVEIQLRDPSIDLEAHLRRPQDIDVLTYRTSSSEGIYLRLASLSIPEVRGWKQADMTLTDRSVTSVPGLENAGQAIETDISILSFNSSYLPAPYAPRKWNTSGRWMHNPQTLTIVNVSSDDPASLDGMSYHVSSIAALNDRDTIAQSFAGSPEESITTFLPDYLPDAIVSLTHDLTDSASTDGEKALILQDYLRDPERFTYTLTPPSGSGYSTIENFLFNDHRGYCIHFASSMALMARIAGIPSRVAIGFSPGDRQDDGSYLVTSHDMHAWTELYFDHLGWVPFEVTVPSSSQPATFDNGDHLERGENGSEPTQETIPPSQQITSTPSQPQEDHAETSSIPHISLLRPLIAAIILILLLAVPRSIRSAQRYHRLHSSDPSKKVGGIWTELAAIAVDCGYRWEGQTPQSICSTLIAQFPPDCHKAVRRLATAEQEARYAAQMRAYPDLDKELNTIVNSLYSALSHRRRIAIFLFPSSIFRRLP